MMMLSFPLPLTMILSLYVCVRAQVDRSVVGWVLLWTRKAPPPRGKRGEETVDAIVKGLTGNTNQAKGHIQQLPPSAMPRHLPGWTNTNPYLLSSIAVCSTCFSDLNTTLLTSSSARLTISQISKIPVWAAQAFLVSPSFCINQFWAPLFGHRCFHFTFITFKAGLKIYLVHSYSGGSPTPPFFFSHLFIPFPPTFCFHSLLP